MVAQQVGHMRDGVAGTHEEFVIELEGAVPYAAVELLYESDIGCVVLVLDEQSEEGSELWDAAESTSPAATICLALANEDFRKEDLLEERISFGLVVNLEVIDLQIEIKSILLVVLLTNESESFDSEKR